MLRLTRLSQTQKEAVLQVEGWLTGKYLQALRDEIEHCLQESERLVLDLDQVKQVDIAGLELLERWPQIKLRGGSPFIRVLLAGRQLV